MELGIEELIMSVRNKTPLWDCKDKHYHSRDVQRNLWVKVTKEMGSDVTTVKKKWKGLRDMFRREYKKVYLSGTDGATKYDSSWAFYNEMQFLSQTFDPKSITGNTPSSRKPSPSVCAWFKYEEDSSTSQLEEEVPSPLWNFEETPSETQQTGNPTSQPSKRKISQNSYETEDPFGGIENPNTEKQDVASNSDYQFLVSLVPFLQKVPFHRKLHVRNKLQQVFIDEAQ